MIITIQPSKLNGIIPAVPSKSHAHRLLICAAFSDQPTEIICTRTCKDIEATVTCLRAIGAQILRSDNGYTVIPVDAIPPKACLHCGESGSTLRFLLPIVGALGIDAEFCLEGSLPGRPITQLLREMEKHGCKVSMPCADKILCSGRLRPGAYTISGSETSQFATGLLLAMSLMDGNSHLSIQVSMESRPYISLTQNVLRCFGVDTSGFFVHGSYPLRSPCRLTAEGDWSNGAFFLASAHLGNTVTVSGLNPSSIQGDRIIVEALQTLVHAPIIDIADIPDLFPILAVTAGALHGATFINISRLRLKESDRVASVVAMLENLGATVCISSNSLTISSAAYHGCTIDSCSDHRIAMSAAIAATVASGPVTILGAECVAKSYPSFWEDYRSLGGNYEQYLW